MDQVARDAIMALFSVDDPVVQTGFKWQKHSIAIKVPNARILVTSTSALSIVPKRKIEVLEL